MPAVDNAVVPKPLTYTLMYHGLWAIIFLLTAMVYWGIFFASGQPAFRAIVPPLGLVGLALIAGFGAWLSYMTRLGVLLGEAPLGVAAGEVGVVRAEDHAAGQALVA